MGPSILSRDAARMGPSILSREAAWMGPSASCSVSSPELFALALPYGGLQSVLLALPMLVPRSDILLPNSVRDELLPKTHEEVVERSL